MHKAAGAAAAAGRGLAAVKAVAEAAARAIGSMGCSLTVCNLPGQEPSDRCAPLGPPGAQRERHERRGRGVLPPPPPPHCI